MGDGEGPVSMEGGFALVLLGAGVGGFIGGLAATFTYYLGWQHWTPWSGLPFVFIVTRVSVVTAISETHGERELDGTPHTHPALVE